MFMDVEGDGVMAGVIGLSSPSGKDPSEGGLEEPVLSSISYLAWQGLSHTHMCCGNCCTMEKVPFLGDSVPQQSVACQTQARLAQTMPDIGNVQCLWQITMVVMTLSVTFGPPCSNSITSCKHAWESPGMRPPKMPHLGLFSH
ncbi:hypothetical protein EV401DRAFT_1886685 [Pisolithus croceorrhizus]|nr:hypothetical protein EV401DRAFT_1886685 [Pisolithus croceorrhizus]